MIEDIYLRPAYWLLLASIMLVCYKAIDFHFFDFKFLIALYISQYITHITLVYGLSNYFIFCVLFLLFLIFGYHVFAELPNIVLLPIAQREHLHRRLIWICKAVLVSYYTFRLATYPVFSGAFDIGARLAQQQESRLLFFLSLVMFPLFVACVYDWSLKKRLSFTDWFVLLITTLGILSGGSKASIAPLLIAYLGVSSYLGRQIRLSPFIIIAGSAAGLTLIAILEYYFPFLSTSEIADMMLYRVVANTDNIEFLYQLNLDPAQYPFAGAISIIPFVGKYLGASIEYPVGVWLYGLRYGDWSGFGPNSGFLIEQYGNMGFLGVLSGFFLGVVVRWACRLNSVVRVMVLSFCYTFLVESTLFFMNLIFCALVVFLSLVMHLFRQPRCTPIAF